MLRMCSDLAINGVCLDLELEMGRIKSVYVGNAR